MYNPKPIPNYKYHKLDAPTTKIRNPIPIFMVQDIKSIIKIIITIIKTSLEIVTVEHQVHHQYYNNLSNPSIMKI
jgi:hypothetical protein